MRVEVVFSQPDKFTDIRDSYNSSDMGRKANLDQIRDYLVNPANKYVSPGQKLTVPFTGIDLAGAF